MPILDSLLERLEAIGDHVGTDTDCSHFGELILPWSHTCWQEELSRCYRTFHPKAAAQILFKCTWNMLQDRSSARPTKQVRVNLRKLKCQAPFSNLNSVRLEISYKKKKLQKKKKEKIHMWRLNNMLLNNQWITEEIKQYLETNEKAVPRGKFMAMQTYLRK